MKKFNLKKLLNGISYAPQLDLICQMFSDEEKNKIPVFKYLYNINNTFYMLLENQYAKTVIGYDYNYIFLKQDIFGFTTGYFQRWGKTKDDNPDFAPIGPEILDIEISVNGCPNACPFCYKNNKNVPPTNMTLDTFKSIINKMPRVLTQVAFGITGVKTNPDFIPMMKYCREIGILPNFTLSGIDLTDDLADQLSEVAGALAVSAYASDKNVCYNTVKKFTDRGMSQVNIHLMVSQQTLPFVKEVLADRLTDPRLENMHAIVFLGVKPKGRAKNEYTPLTLQEYGDIVQYSMKAGFNFGFDSCSAPKFESVIKNIDIKIEPTIKDQLIESSESCESSLFSSYVNTSGEYWHCSFAENEDGQNCVDVTKVKNFITDVWYSDTVKKFRENSINTMVNGCRRCTVFPSINP